MRYPRYKQGNLDDKITLTQEFKAALDAMRHKYDEPADEQARRLVVADEHPLPFDKQSDYASAVNLEDGNE
jgi:hypothetical protein